MKSYDVGKLAKRNHNADLGDTVALQAVARAQKAVIATSSASEQKNAKMQRMTPSSFSAQYLAERH